MADSTSIIKRVPKWAWFVGAGVAVGGIALQRRQAAKDDTEAAVTGTDPATGQATGSAPPGVIVPPVIMGGGGGDGSAQIDPGIPAIYSGLNDVFSSGFTTVLDTLSRHDDSIIGIIANGGGSPNPASQQPTVVNVTIPGPDPSPAPVPAPAKGSCPSGFPQGSPPNCYKDCQHVECGSNGKQRINKGHCYSDGRRVHVENQPLSTKC